MFYLNDTLTAEAARTNGLIAKIIADDFDNEVINCCKQIAGLSTQVSRHQCSNVSFLMHRDLYTSPL